MAKTKKDTLALFEVIHSAKGMDPALKIPASRRAISDPARAGGVDARRGIWFRLTPVHAVLAFLLIALVVVVAYLAGSKKTAKPVLSPSVEDIRKGPADPSVLEPKPTPADAPPPAVTPVETTPGFTAQTLTGPRVNGLTYVIVQSYPAQEAAMEMRDFLARAGIPCTVEKNHLYAPNGWYCVISSRGFPGSSSREYEECVKAIRAASSKYPGSKFMKFQPQPYKWR